MKQSLSMVMGVFLFSLVCAVANIEVSKTAFGATSALTGFAEQAARIPASEKAAKSFLSPIASLSITNLEIKDQKGMYLLFCLT